MNAQMITEINEQDGAQVLVEEGATIVNTEATVVVEENTNVESQQQGNPTKPEVKTFNDLSSLEIDIKSDSTPQPEQVTSDSSQTKTTDSAEEIPDEEEPSTEVVEETIVEDGIKEEDTATQETNDVVTTTDSDAEIIEEDVDDSDEIIEEEVTEQVNEEVKSSETTTLVDLDGNTVEVPLDKIQEFYVKMGEEAKKRQQSIETPKEESKVEKVKEPKVEETPKPVVEEKSQPTVQKDTAPEFVSEVSDGAPRRVYDRDHDLEHIMLMTVKSIKRCLNHVTNVVASTKNNRHFTLKVESNAIQNLFLHGICKSGFYSREELIQALQEILNHWNENLGVLPENNFTVCFMRLKLGDRMLNAKVRKNSLLRDEEIRQKIYSHYMSTRWEWSYRSIVPMLELADSCESKTRFVDGEVKTRLCVNGEWTPFLEDMEVYFGVKNDPYADVTIPEDERLRYVGITLHVLGTNNPRAVGHIVKMNAIRKALLIERAEKIKSGKIEIQADPRRVKTSEVDARSLQMAMNQNMPKNTD